MADNIAHPHYDRRRVLTFDELPDNVLIDIFDFCVFRYQYLGFRQFSAYETKRKIESWKSMVQVCRRWRCLVFGSPRRLNLQLVYIPRRSATARKVLDVRVWPALPIYIFGSISEQLVYNVVPGLKHRICQINLICDASPKTEELWTAITQVQFPELAGLYLSLPYGPVRAGPLVRSTPRALPDSFLGGSAPRLRHFYLDGIPFPGLPKLLLSTTHLVRLSLHNIPHSGFISPEAMATCLSMSTCLKSLHLEFESFPYYPDFKNRRPSSPDRSVLPTLEIFRFRGMNNYLEDSVARIDAPQLYRLSTKFFIYSTFDIASLTQFISRTPTLGPGAYEEARLIFDSGNFLFKLRQSHPKPSDHGMAEVDISIPKSIVQFSFRVRTCTSLRPFLTMENLYIDGDLNSSFWSHINDIENTKWLDLLLPFTSVKNLYLSKLCSPRIALVLQKLTGGRTTEVLPALQSILLEPQIPKRILKGITKFVSARGLINHPVVISVWHREERDMSWEVDN